MQFNLGLFLTHNTLPKNMVPIHGIIYQAIIEKHSEKIM